MKYDFTDCDKRTYKRETRGEIRVEAGQVSGEEVKISLTDSGKSVLGLTLSRKEATAIISALNAASYGCKSTITVNNDK
jgi:hypothetical protein